MPGISALALVERIDPLSLVLLQRDADGVWSDFPDQPSFSNAIYGRALWASTESIVVASDGDEGSFHWDGTEWAQHSIGSWSGPATVAGIAGRTLDDLWLVVNKTVGGTYARLFHWDEASWTEDEAFSALHLDTAQLWVSPTGVKWAVGYETSALNCRIYRRGSGGGDSWVDKTTPWYGTLDGGNSRPFCVWGTADDDVWVGGGYVSSSGRTGLWHTANEGSSWETAFVLGSGWSYSPLMAVWTNERNVCYGQCGAIAGTGSHVGHRYVGTVPGGTRYDMPFPDATTVNGYLSGMSEPSVVLLSGTTWSPTGGQLWESTDGTTWVEKVELNGLYQWGQFGVYTIPIDPGNLSFEDIGTAPGAADLWTAQRSTGATSIGSFGD